MVGVVFFFGMSNASVGVVFYVRIIGVSSVDWYNMVFN